MGTRAYHGKSRMRFNIDGLLAADERARRAEAAKVREIVEQLKRLMTPDAYDAWWNTAPDNNAEFLAAATAKLADELAGWDEQEKRAEELAALLPETHSGLTRIVDAMNVYGMIERQKELMGMSTIEAAQENIEKCLELWGGRDLEMYQARLQEEIDKEKRRI